MTSPHDKNPGAPPAARKEPLGLSEEQRSALGEPPGKRALDEAARQAHEGRAVDQLQRDLEEVESFRMPLMEHLVELKNRLLVAMVALILGSLVGFVFALPIYDELKAPFEQALAGIADVEGSLSIVHSPFEGIYVYLKISLIAGVVLASPVISYQGWQFIAPGLYRTERKVVAPLSFASVFLFLMGSSFCFYVIFPYAFKFFIEVLAVDVNLSADGYLSAVMRMMLAFGLSFQLPVATWFLAHVGIVDHRDLIAGFRYAVVAIFILAAFITPPDPLTQTMLAIPMVLLYAFSIVIAWAFSRKTRDDEAPSPG
jgi:sec-independent protein translocase protein TatC